MKAQLNCRCLGRMASACGTDHNHQPIRAIRVAKATNCPRCDTLSYCVCNAFAGLRRAARDAGMIVASTVIAVMSRVAIARINGSDARIA